MTPSIRDVSLESFTGTPFRDGLVVGTFLCLLFLLVSGSLPGTIAAAMVLYPLGLAAAYAVDTCYEWARWLGIGNASEAHGARRDGDRRRLRSGERPASDDARDQLDRLRERYVSGELSEEQFERKLATLLETETPEDAREYARRAGERRASELQERE